MYAFLITLQVWSRPSLAPMCGGKCRPRVRLVAAGRRAAPLIYY
jgi:hypothetical protein